MARKGGRRPYQRSARVGELLREIIAGELERIDDPDLAWVSITGVDVPADIERATVYFSTLDEGGDDSTVDVLGGYRIRLQRAIGAQARLRRTPELVFRPDQGVRAGARVEEILATLREERGSDEDEADQGEPDRNEPDQGESADR